MFGFKSSVLLNRPEIEKAAHQVVETLDLSAGNSANKFQIMDHWYDVRLGDDQ